MAEAPLDESDSGPPNTHPNRRVGISCVVLYDNATEWLFTVGANPHALAFGAIGWPAAAADEEAQRVFEDHVLRHWGHVIQPAWNIDATTAPGVRPWTSRPILDPRATCS